MTIKYPFLLLFAFAIISFSTFASNHSRLSPLTLPIPQSEVANKKQKVRRRILEQYKVWRGVKYRRGGTGKNGIDCSALVQKIFSRGLSKYLPRTTARQIKEGRKIAVKELLPGDLIFFRTKPRVRHVGVYLGDDKFVHASSSRGVIISNLGSHYWEGRIETARRIIE